MSLNKCYYSEGSRHSCCTHQHYCIFNKKRWVLETKITSLTKEHDELNRLKNSYVVGNYVGNIEYKDIINRLEVIKEDINNLIQFKKRILGMRVEGYGY